MRALIGSLTIFILPVFIAAPARSQTDDSWKLYDDSHLARIDITIDPTLLQWIMEHVESDSEHVATFRFRNSWIDETVDSIGFRIRGNTSRSSAKKSFKVSFNTFFRGREFHGVDKLNLNGEHNDPSIIRSKLCFDLFGDAGITASRANHVELFINGVYRGLYISVEHVDDEFLWKHFSDDSGNLWKCLFPADLTYLGEDPELYRQIHENGRPAYELKTNEETADFSMLARLIRVLHATPDADLPDSLERILDVHAVLKYFAMNLLTGSWDDYWSLMNNYYLYHCPSEDRFHLIPYDYDNTFGIDWFGIDWATASPYAFPKVVAGPRPLAERLLAHAQYRDLYTHFLQFLNARVCALAQWESRVDSIRTMILPSALADSFRTLDWGFDSSDFVDSYSVAGYRNQHVKTGLKQFAQIRSASIAGQLSTLGSPPIAYEYRSLPSRPSPEDSVWFEVSCYASRGMKDAALELVTAASPLPRTVPLAHRPVDGTKKVEDHDRWVGVLPPLGIGGSGAVIIRLEDSSGAVARYPRSGSIVVSSSRPASASLLVNEFMADNDAVAQDPAGEYDDWIELYNPTSEHVPLTGKYLTDKPDNLTKWRFMQEGLVLEPGGFLVVWCDEQDQPGIHTNFKLSAGGEFIAVVDSDGTSILDSLTFGPQETNVSFGRYPDGSSSWQVVSATPGSSNLLTAVPEIAIPGSFALAAYPNPFNPAVTIRCALPVSTDIEMSLCDLLGRTVWRSVRKQVPAGVHTERWDGRSDDGSAAPSGVYILRVTAGTRQKSLKLMLVR